MHGMFLSEDVHEWYTFKDLTFGAHLDSRRPLKNIHKTLFYGTFLLYTNLDIHVNVPEIVS